MSTVTTSYHAQAPTLYDPTGLNDQPILLPYNYASYTPNSVTPSPSANTSTSSLAQSLHLHQPIPSRPAHPPAFRRSAKPSALSQSYTPGSLHKSSPYAPHKETSLARQEEDAERQAHEQRKRDKVLKQVRLLAKAMVHPRRSRREKRVAHAGIKAREEQERLREIEEFLESGRAGPIQVAVY